MRTNEKLPTIEQEEIEQLKEQMEKLQQEIDEQFRSKEEAEAAATEAQREGKMVKDQALNIVNHNQGLRNMLDELKLPQEKRAQCGGLVGAHETSDLENKNAKMTATLDTKRQTLKDEKQNLEIANRKSRTWKLKREDSHKKAEKLKVKCQQLAREIGGMLFIQMYKLSAEGRRTFVLDKWSCVLTIHALSLLPYAFMDRSAASFHRIIIGRSVGPSVRRWLKEMSITDHRKLCQK